MYSMEHGGGWNKTHGRVDKHLCLDSFAIMKGWPGSDTASITWKSGAAVVGQLDGEQLILTYVPIGGDLVKQAVELSRINNGFGGKPRTYFLCPFCGKRVQKLYFQEKRWRCRVCANLSYYTRQVTHNDEEAAWRMERILRRDFGITGDLAPIDMQFMLPDKPKWMRWPTYSKNMARLRRAQEAYNQAFMAGASRILGKGWK